MPDADFRSGPVAGRTIGLDDYMFGATPSVSDFAQAAKSDTLRLLISTIFGNAPPDPLVFTAAELAAFRNFGDLLTTGEVTAAAVAAALARFTNTEKTKLGDLSPILTFGIATGQTAAEFSYPAVTGFNPINGFDIDGQLFLFQTQNVTVNPADADTHVTINLGGAVYTPTGVGDTGIPLEEWRELTTYVGVGRGLLDCVLIGPTDLLEDDVIDVTRTGLPALNVDNYKKLFADHDTPRVWVGHREVIAAVPALGTWHGFSARGGIYLGAQSSAPNTVSAQRFYYNTRSHVWREGQRIGGVDYYVNTAFQVLPGNDTDDIWLGEQPDDAAASGLVAPFNTSHRYHFYNEGADTVRTLNNSTYVDPVSAFDHFVAEPISSPSGPGSISGLTAGGGITLDGLEGTISSGTIALAIDTSLAAFPTIPLAKGGTGATTDSGARTALGLGTAAVLDTGATDGLIPLIGTGNVLSPDLLAPNGMNDYVLTYQTGGTSAWAAVSPGGLGQVTHTADFTGQGTTASPLTLVGTTLVVADSSSYLGSGIIGVTITDLPGLRDASNGQAISFQVPSGLSNDSNPISIRVNGQSNARGLHEHTGTRVTGSQLQNVGDWLTAQVILNGFYTFGSIGSGAGNVASVSAGAGLINTGSSTDPIIGIAVAATSFPTIPINKGGTGATNAADARTALMLGSAAEQNAGTSANNVPQLDATAHILDSLIPSTITRNTALETAINQHLTNALVGNTEQGITVTFDSNEKLNFIVTGAGAATVASDTTLTGDGSTGMPLGIADGGVDIVQLDTTNVPQDDYVLAYDTNTTSMFWKQDATASPGQGITAVAHDTAFAGDGTAGDPITMVVTGGDFPIITTLKGGLGIAAANIVGVRTNLGLGTAALVDTGAADGNVGLLGGGGTFAPSLLAPMGNAGQVLSRSGAGMAWVSAVTRDIWVASASIYTNVSLTEGRFDVTSTSLGTNVDLPDTNVLFFQIPVGVPTDSTHFTIQINGQTERAYVAGSGGNIEGGHIAAGDWTSIIRIGGSFYSADNIEADDAFINAAQTGRVVTFTKADGSTFQIVFDATQFHGVAGARPFNPTTFIGPTTFEYGDYAAAGNILYINSQTTASMVTPTTVTTGINFLHLPLLDEVTNNLPYEQLAHGVPTDGQVVQYVLANTRAEWTDPTGGGVDPLLADLETLTDMSTSSIRGVDLFFFRDQNVHQNRKLRISRVGEYLADGTTITADGTTGILTAVGGGGGTVVAANPAGATSTNQLNFLTVGADTYFIEDDVVDVTSIGLPVLTATNYRRMFIDHDTPRVWVGHREVLTATRAGGTTAEFTNASFDGAVSVDPVVTSIDRFIYHTTLHRWETSRTANGTFFFLPLSFNTIFTTTVGDTNPIWLGEQPDDETAIGLIDTFDNASAYYYYHEGSDTVRLLDNTTYTAATGRMVNYGAEPISAPTGTGTDTNDYATAGTFDITSGQLSLEVRGTSGFTTFTVPAITLPAAGGGVSSVTAGTGIDVSGSANVVVGLEPQYQTPHISGGTLTLSLDGANGFLITLNRTDVPNSGQTVGDTITLTMPDPLNAPSGVTATSTTRFAITGGSLYFVVDPAGSAIRFGNFRAGRLYTLRFWNTTNGWVLVEPPIGDIQGIDTSDTSGLTGGQGFGTPALVVRPDRANVLSESALATDDEFLFYNTSVTATEKVTLAQILAEVPGGGGTDSYVDTAALTLSGLNLTATLGRTGTLSDVVSTALALPDPTMADFSARTNMASTSISHSDIFFFRDVSESSNANRSLTVGNLATYLADGSTITASSGKLTSVGSGTITSIVTATASGLDGGATTGTATLAVNASNFAGYQNTTAAANDTMMIYNQADGETERITISQLGLTLSSGSVTDTGNQRSFVVPASGVTGTANDIILTTGLATNLNDGDEFYFTPSAVNTGAVTVNIDANGADALVHYRDSGLRALNADELQSQPVIITYQMSNDRFLWRPAAGSTASFYQVAEGNGDLAVLGPQGVFEPDRLGISGMAGYVLSYQDTQAVWVAAGGGTGTITSIVTAAMSGLQGGMTSGDVTLSLDIAGLDEFQVADADSADEVILRDASSSTNPFRSMTLGRFVGRMAGNTTTLGEASGRIFVADGGITVTQLADAGITEPKLFATNVPSNGQVLSYAGGTDVNFTWIDATGGGGAGDITEVTTSATSGLQGGMTSGAVDLSLDLSGLAVADGAVVHGSNDRLYIEDRDQTPYQRQISIFELQQALMQATDTSHENPAENDRFFVNDVSYQGGIPRYIRWDGMRTRFTNDAPLDWADAANEQDDFAPTRKTVAESLAAVTEPQLVISNDPTDNYVLSYDGTNSIPIWRAEGTTPVQTHNRYFALGDTRTFVEADYTGGLTFTADTFTVPTFTTNQYWAIAVPVANPITNIIATTNPEQNLTSQFTNEADVSISGVNHQIWISNAVIFPAGSGTPIRLET